MAHLAGRPLAMVVVASSVLVAVGTQSHGRGGQRRGADVSREVTRMNKAAVLAVTLTTALGSATVVSADTISFDPDGGGALAPVTIDLFDVAPGNSLTLNMTGLSQPGLQTTVLFQANLTAAQLGDRHPGRQQFRRRRRFQVPCGLAGGADGQQRRPPSSLNTAQAIPTSSGSTLAMTPATI